MIEAFLISTTSLSDPASPTKAPHLILDEEIPIIFAILIEQSNLLTDYHRVLHLRSLSHHNRIAHLPLRALNRPYPKTPKRHRRRMRRSRRNGGPD